MKARGIPLCALAAVAAAAAAAAAPSSMRGVRLLTIVESEPGLEARFAELGVPNVWAEHGRFSAEVPAAAWPIVNRTAAERNWTVTRLQPDMQAQIDAERAARAAHPYPPPPDASAEQRRREFYAAFRTIEEIEEHISALVDRAPAGLTVERFVYGTTHFGREMVALRVVGAASEGNVTKFWQHGVQHGGEWITAMVTLYSAEELIDGYGTDAQLTRLADELEWVFAPVVNVDGFVHSWAEASTRNWRKSRQMHPANEVALAECLLACEPDCAPNACAGCVGVDTNRNWPYQWGSEHASPNPCSNSYHGPEPETEPENTAVADYIRAQQSAPETSVVGAIDHHCCGDMWMTPWGFTVNPPPLASVLLSLVCAAHRRRCCCRSSCHRTTTSTWSWAWRRARPSTKSTAATTARGRARSSL